MCIRDSRRSTTVQRNQPNLILTELKWVHSRLVELSDVNTHILKAEFHNTDTDILARILADTSDTRDFLKLFLWQADRGSRPTHRHTRDDPREDVGVSIVECGLNAATLESHAIRPSNCLS